MAHAMYSSHAWNILVFQLDSDLGSNTQKHIDPITSKGN
jgi:hypothetical protein